MLPPLQKNWLKNQTGYYLTDSNNDVLTSSKSRHIMRKRARKRFRGNEIARKTAIALVTNVAHLR